MVVAKLQRRHEVAVHWVQVPALRTYPRGQEVQVAPLLQEVLYTHDVPERL